MKIVVISDTHSKHNEIKSFPEADCIIHCGDFSHSALQGADFLHWFSKTPYKYKIVIAGNHEIYFTNTNIQRRWKETFKDHGIHLLFNESITLDNIKFWGSPYSVEFLNWAFMETDEKLEEIWTKIPDDVDVVVTHSPAYKIGDKTATLNVGSKTLLKRLKELKKLKAHFYGHIHEDAGLHKADWLSFNASYQLGGDVLHKFEISSSGVIEI